MDVARLLETSSLELIAAIPDPAAPPAGLAIPEDAGVVPIAAGRMAWITEQVVPGDLVLLPGGGRDIGGTLAVGRSGAWVWAAALVSRRDAPLARW
jgi:hypothetical protein